MPSEDDKKSRKELLAELRQVKMKLAIFKAYKEIIEEEEEAARMEKKMGSDHKEVER